MKTYIKSIYLLVIIAILGSCKQDNFIQTEFTQAIIPVPNSFELTQNSTKVLSPSKLSIFLPDTLKSAYNLQLIKDNEYIELVEMDSMAQVKIVFEPSLSVESYNLQIKNNEITIFHSSMVGFQYALTSLEQLLRFNSGVLKECNISDDPRFKYRGMHLDVARHFYKMEDIKKFLDYMAYYKFNKFHWHLTDDQGWRLEIKKYPKLQEVAAYREGTLIGHYNDQPQQFDTIKYGGYYTQEEVKEIVKYAGERNIEVIPEIEMPGHASAAIAAYPFLGCTYEKVEVAKSWGVFDDVFCPYPRTFEFLENVLDEVIELFPSPYIHIGGDECPKNHWRRSKFCSQLSFEQGLRNEDEIQSYFIQRIEKNLNSKGKKIIGWDEILEGGLAPNATVMSWRGEAGGIEAASNNHDVIMTPTTYCYFDYYQSERPDEPLAIGGYLPLEKVYHWNPIPLELSKDKHKYVLGGQANTWTEYIPEYSKVEYMTYTRGMAMSEVLWSSSKDYGDFIQRFDLHYDYWKNKGVNLANHTLDIKTKIYAGNGESVSLNFDLPHKTQILFTPPSGKEMTISTIDEPILLKENGKYRLQALRNDIKGNPSEFILKLHKGSSASITLDHDPHPKYPGNGKGSLVNGVEGSNEKYGGSEWLGFKGDDCNVNLNFDENVAVDSIRFKFYSANGQWIYLPNEIKIFESSNGKDFTLIAAIDSIDSASKLYTNTVSIKNVNTKFLRIEIKNHGTIEEGLQGEGNPAWLFVDEIYIF